MMNVHTTSSQTTTVPPHSIKLLPEFLIDQIKAGEIIERPSNLIKEVIENSIDAEASKIEIHLMENGLKQITIRDNGKGISFQDLPYAFCRHATSKITRFQDLYCLNSFGFRGEALASIAAIAQVTCMSRCQGQQGGQVSLSGGQAQEPIEQKDLPYGTQIIIKNLFFNTPVRLNFIKSQTSEKNALMHVLRAFLISHPQIEFHIKWDQDEKSIFRPTDRFRRFTQALSGNRWGKDDFGLVNKCYQDYSITGFYGKLAKKSGQTKNQYLFVNKRSIQDRPLHRIISLALEALWPQGSSGPYLFELKAPVNQVDVNVHPNKTVVKFADSSIVHSLFHSTLKAGLPLQGQTKMDEQKGQFPGNQHREDNADNTNDRNANRGPGFRSYEQRDQTTASLESISIGHRYRMLSQEKGPPLVVDGMAIMQFHISSIINQLAHQEQVPLIIGIPFRGQEVVNKIRNYPHWERDHFAFNFVEKDLAVLVAIPHPLVSLPQRAIIFNLLGEQELFAQEMKSEPLSVITLHNLISKHSLKQLIDAKSITILNPELLATLFQ